MKVVSSPVLECDFGELFNEFIAPKSSFAVTYFAGALRGEEAGNRFRIPSADGENDVFFDSRELLCRFASLPTPTQAIFLCSIREAMEVNKVGQMLITIPWSKTKTRKLRVEVTGETKGCRVLNFKLLS